MKIKPHHFKKAPCLAVLGTGSDVGKSITATALCRLFTRQGVRTAPFKAQNMSNNSGVTPEGLEMGRAQIVQAEAAGIPPHVDMNPILLKPTSEIGSQIVLMGKALENRTAEEYLRQKKRLFQDACAALDRLREKYELVIMEGAGSCAEVNLMKNDIVNFRMAEYAEAAVILVADIHKGGVFAQIVGTLACLSQPRQDRIAGLIINRFRGDISLFEEGKDWIEQQTGKKVFGILPWYTHIAIDAEDSVVIENPEPVCCVRGDVPAVAVIRIPHIANFTDFDPLASLPGLQLDFIEKIQDISFFKAVILPGSKNTRFDLEWLNETGWTARLSQYAHRRGRLLGICGGYQMMGRYVHDPDGLEGRPGTTRGLSLLPVETVLQAPKTTTRTCFERHDRQGTGYEIHMGRTTRTGGNPLFEVRQRNGITCRDQDGCVTDDDRIMGTYIHGLFDNPGITEHWLRSIGLSQVKISNINGLAARDQQYDRLADHFKSHIDMHGLAERSGVDL